MVVGSVGHEGVDFEEGAFVQEQADSVPCGPSAARANGLLTLQTTAKPSALTLGSEVFQCIVNLAVHGSFTSDSVFDSNAHSHKAARCSPHKLVARAFLMSMF